MMSKLMKLVVVALLAFGFNATAQQDSQGGKLNYEGKAASMRVVPSMASRTGNWIPAPAWSGQEPQDGKYFRNAKVEVVPGKDPQTEDDQLAVNPGRLDKAINLTRSLESDFIVNNNVGSPSDPALAVGPDHVVVVYNTGYLIYDKDGNDLTGPLSVNNIFTPGGCCDLTATYDNNADRWVLTYLFVGAGMELAVSDGPDPLTANWNVYAFPQIADYNKLSRWTDGYYITDNGPNDVWVIDRDAALAGDPNASIQGFVVNGIQSPNGGFTSAQVANITDDVMPTTGGAPLVYMRDDGFQGVTVDEMWIWTLDVDFDTPANSTVSAPETFPTTPFINVFDGGGFSNLTQPGGGTPIDALQSTIMNQTQFRKFADHNSMVLNFVVDTDASAGELAGIRWYEFRQTTDGGPWSMEQEGTYTAPDGRHAWNGSMAMDNQGNIGMGYSSMAGPTTPNPLQNRVGAYFTGQLGSDNPGAGVMNVSEVFVGSAGNIGGLRFGDYAKVDVDPSNDKEFWFITEYQNTNHVAVFQIQSDLDNDIGVVTIDAPVDGDLSAPQDVTVTIFNFGLNDASGFDVSYSIDGAVVATEPFSGVIISGESAQHTFTAQGDFSVVGQTYEITSSIDFAADEFAENDSVTRNVTHINPNDVGVIGLTALIDANSQVTINIENFGTATQTSIPVFYTLNGNTVQETYTGSIAFGATDTYTFTATEDLSEIGDYVFTAGTELAGDADETNDDITVTVTNAICAPVSDCSGFGDGVTQIQLADQDIVTICSGSGYSDDTDIIFNFVLDENPFEGTIQLGFANSNYAIFIDFNDNNIFEANEVIAEGIVAVADLDSPITVDFSSFPDNIAGTHLMRVRGADQGAGQGDVLNPCEDLTFGRTNDYTANISGTLGTTDELFAATDLQVHALGNDQFEVMFNDTSSFSEKLPITVYNTLGQTLAYYTVDNNGGGYTKTIDMSYVSKGIYFVKVGTNDLNKVKRIIVGAN